MKSNQQTKFKTEWKNASRRHFYIKCADCGRFCDVIKEYHGKKVYEVTLYCDNCQNEKTISAGSFSYRGINKTESFSAIWKEDHDSVKTWKESVYPIHSSDLYINRSE